MLNFIEFVSLLNEALFKKVKVRIRNGKVQRNKKVINKSGYKLVHGQPKRMSPMERRHRKISQRRGARKRKAKLSKALRKRRISIRRSNRLRGKR